MKKYGLIKHKDSRRYQIEVTIVIYTRLTDYLYK